jgi:hypothetical protein
MEVSMFALTLRGSSPKRICAAVATMAAMAVAAAGLAGPAFAVPNDTITKIDTDPNHTFQFGGSGSCVSNQAPTADANLNWREDLTAGTVQPLLTGSLCLQDTTNTYRVNMELFYLDSTPGPGATHVEIGEYSSLQAAGNGGALNSFSVNLSGPKVNAANVDHAHITIQQLVGGVWQNVGVTRVADYP